MGLMYILPASDDGSDGDRVEIKNDDASKTLILKSYGLPMIFWGYLAAALSVVALMWLASRAVILKLLSYQNDPSMIFLGNLVYYTLVLTPIILLAFFFYEKIIIKNGSDLTLLYKIFFIPVWKTHYKLTSPDALSVNHYMASPNMAKLRNQQGINNAEAMKQFENKGYFELRVQTAKKTYLIDRHSRKADLLKMKELLSRY
jgi:hypothetical protein